MKLSWKLFFITTPVFILLLTLFGTWIIQENFQNSINREKEQCLVENQMFQNSYELSKNTLTSEQREKISLQNLVEKFYRRQKAGEGGARILSADGEILYRDNELELEHHIMERLDGDYNVGCEIVEDEGGQRYVVVMCRSANGEFIETSKNVTEIFGDRARMYSRYQAGAFLMAVLAGGVILLVLFVVMRNMQKLSRATQQFARGQYDTKVQIKSRDEIGRLAADFNWMANAMNMQMQQLRSEVSRQEEFTAAFAHELKTPLTSIIGYADTIRQMELSRQETDMCADYIYRQGKRLQSLSYKLLEMTLAGQQEIAYREIRVPDFLEEVKKTAAVSLQESGVILQVRAQDGVIYGDRELLSSVFLNLIDNARKATEPGRHIRVTGRRIPGGYCISVEDEGRGMAPEELPKIAEPFYMVDKSRARKEGGAGLGLALCRKIITMHRGSWQFESEPGKGLRVTVLLGHPEAAGRARPGRQQPRRARQERKEPRKKRSRKTR